MTTMVRLPANNANYYNSEMRRMLIKIVTINDDGEEQVTFELSQLSQHTRLLLTDEWPCKQWDCHCVQNSTVNIIRGPYLHSIQI